MTPSPCSMVTFSPSTPMSSFARLPERPRWTSTSFRHCTSNVSKSDASPPEFVFLRRTTTFRRMRQTRGTGVRWGLKSFVRVRTQPSSGKGVRNPREPAAKESTGGIAPVKRETAQVSVPSPPIVITKSMCFAKSSLVEKARVPVSTLLSTGWSASSCGSTTVVTPWDESHAAMSCRVAITTASPGFAISNTVLGRSCHCITRLFALFDSTVRPSFTTMGASREQPAKAPGEPILGYRVGVMGD
mmetsp:Transcript_27766/g.92287  ORF Transcript_27766/g.92287 Transcript_27766/m.92287 type:complete len:244 (+) Transcript_27766:550-1281(+)